MNDAELERRRALARGASQRWKERHRSDLAFLERRRAQQRADYWNNHAGYIAKQREFTERHRQTINAKNREYYWAHREERRAYNKAWRLANLDRVRQDDRDRNRADYWADPKKIQEYNRAWRRAHPESARLSVRLSNHRRRAQAGRSRVTSDEWLDLVDSYGGRCGYCFSDGPLEADHRMPLSRGGTNTLENLIPACRRCNRRKRTKTEPEFRAWLEKQTYGAAFGKGLNCGSAGNTGTTMS